MIAAARVLGGAAAGAALLIAGATVEPVSAQGDACKTEYVTASGRGKFRPFTKTKELEGRGSAMTDAVTTWEREVASHARRPVEEVGRGQGQDVRVRTHQVRQDHRLQLHRLHHQGPPLRRRAAVVRRADRRERRPGPRPGSRR